MDDEDQDECKDYFQKLVFLNAPFDLRNCGTDSLISSSQRDLPIKGLRADQHEDELHAKRSNDTISRASRVSIKTADILLAARKHSAGRTRRTSRYFASNTSLLPSPGINHLAETDHIFIKPMASPKERGVSALELSHLFHLVNAYGQTVFTAVKTFHYENCNILLECDITVLEGSGGGLLSIKGDLENISICSLEFDGTLKELIGTIYSPQVNTCRGHKAKRVHCRDSQGVDQFILQPLDSSNSKPKQSGSEFNIVLANDSKTVAGKLSGDWPSFATVTPAPTETRAIALEDEDGESEHGTRTRESVIAKVDKVVLSKLYGVQFIGEMDVPKKEILLAVLLVIYFQAYDSNQTLRRGVMSSFQAKCCAVFSILICFFTLILFIAIITYVSIR